MNSMQPSKAILVLVIIIQTLGCATAKVWNDESQDKYVEVLPQDKEDVEVALKASGKKYYCNKLYESRYPDLKDCYVKVDDDRFKAKLYQTPKAVVTDVGNTIIIIGEITLQLFAQGSFGHGR
jgi:hypothetical protein